MRKHSSFLYLAGLLALSGCAHPRAIVLSPSAPEGVRVFGVGEASAAPDIARTQLGVEVRAVTQEQAMAEATQRMAAVTAALKQLGIADKDLRTSQYSLSFELDPVAPAPQPSAASAQAKPAASPALPAGHYRVANTLTVTIRDLKLVGRVLQVATEANANTISGIRFDLEDDSAVLAQARSKAVADAQHSAQELAKLAGVELGEVVSITEGEPQNNYAESNTYAMHSAPVAVPVEQGEVTVHYDVQLVFATRRK